MRKYYKQQGVAMTCRGFEEYMRMFSLEEEDLRTGDILDVAAGASSFTVEAGTRGYQAFAVDPRYALPQEEMYAVAAAEIETSTAKLAGLTDIFDYSYYGDLNHHRAMREASLKLFQSDFGKPESRQRYCAGMLPELPFEDGRFGLVVCSHFLFLYAEQFGRDFHLQALKEMLRICKSAGQVRIYPLLSLRFQPSAHLGGLLEELAGEGVQGEMLPSRLPFLPGSNMLLRLHKP
jgi:hypothetical protein